MANVIIGSARSDERGKAHGGAAGDQKNGKEVSTQKWYLHSQGYWRVFRAIDSVVRKILAETMKAACANNHIGYDQYQRNTLYVEAAKCGFDVSKVTKDVETDCSALVRVCCAAAGIMGLPSGFRTPNMPSNLMATGAFVELTDDKYRKKSDYLLPGDILVTPKSGHTVIVLTAGSKAKNDEAVKVGFVLGDHLLRNGMTGTDVRELQGDLIGIGYSCGSCGADGDFGDATEIAVRTFQQRHYLESDGIVGKKTLAKLNALLAAKDPEVPRIVRIVNGQCWAKAAPVDGDRLGVAKEGAEYIYGGETVDGYCLIEFSGANAWVNSKYCRIVG